MNTVLVTGATSGIGRACCTLFAARGSAATRIIAVGRRQEMLSELVDEIDAMKTGAKALAVPLDVSDRAAVAGSGFGQSNGPRSASTHDTAVLFVLLLRSLKDAESFVTRLRTLSPNRP